jgi:large subunit ribosomal protein L1
MELIMKKMSKRRSQEAQKIEPRMYLPLEAVTLLKETASSKFIESAEAHICLNIDPKYSDQQLRTTLILPKGTGKTKKIAVLIQSEKITPELEDLADIIGSDSLIESMTKGEFNFDILISTPDMMPKLAKLGRLLGPKGLMPSPKAGTVTTDVVGALQEFKAGKVEYRADKTGIVHINFGKANFSEEDLALNLSSVYQSVVQNKPSGVKGRYFKSFYVCSTMGPSILVDWTSFKTD